MKHKKTMVVVGTKRKQHSHGLSEMQIFFNDDVGQWFSLPTFTKGILLTFEKILQLLEESREIGLF